MARLDQPVTILAVGDPQRRIIGRAVFSTLRAAAVFSILTGPVKQIRPLYAHAPWLNDPYDTAVSFAMFLVPLIAACCLARVSLCRRTDPLPTLRVADILRGCRIVLAAISLTLVFEWIAVGVGANRADWDGATWLQVGFLVLMTALAARAAIALGRPSARSLAGAAPGQSGSDWLTDMVLVAQAQSCWLGPFRRPALSALSWIERQVVRVVRRHPLWSAASACSLFGVAVGFNQAVREGYDAGSALTVVVLLACGMFGLVVGAGHYLGVVRSDARMTGVERRVLDAVVLTCAGVLVPFAFRDRLWWIVGSNSAAAGVTQLVAMLGIFAAAIFTVVLAAEAVLGLHRGPARP